MAASGKRVAPSVSEREALIASMGHYSNIAESTTISLVNVFALFNGGAIAAGVALISTSVGQSILSNMRWAAVAAIILFAVALIFALILKGLILLFSIRRYRYYRDLLVSFRPNWERSPASPMVGAGTWLFIFTSFFTVVAIVLSIIIVANAP